MAGTAAEHRSRAASDWTKVLYNVTVNESHAFGPVPCRRTTRITNYYYKYDDVLLILLFLQITGAK